MAQNIAAANGGGINNFILTFAHQVGNPNSVSFLMTSYASRAGDLTGNAVMKYNGSPMTLLNSSALNSIYRTAIYYIINPDVGNHTLSVNFNNGACTQIFAEVLNVDGSLDQTIQPDGLNGGAGPSLPGPAAIPAHIGEYIFGMVLAFGSTGSSVALGVANGTVAGAQQSAVIGPGYSPSTDIMYFNAFYLTNPSSVNGTVPYQLTASAVVGTIINYGVFAISYKNPSLTNGSFLLTYLTQ